MQHRGRGNFGFLFQERSRRPFLADRAEDLGVDRRAAGFRVLEFLQHDDPGTFTHHEVAVTEAVDIELVGNFVDGGLIRYPVAVTAEGGLLQATDFGARQGTFVGRATPVLTSGADRVEGLGVDVQLRLGAVRQVVWVRFVAGFSESLELFGLGAAQIAPLEDAAQGFVRLDHGQNLPRIRGAYTWLRSISSLG